MALNRDLSQVKRFRLKLKSHDIMLYVYEHRLRLMKLCSHLKRFCELQLSIVASVNNTNVLLNNVNQFMTMRWLKCEII